MFVPLVAYVVIDDCFLTDNINAYIKYGFVPFVDFCVIIICNN